MRWVRKEKKEASLVVDASLPNPQPECIQSTYDFYRQLLAKQKRQKMPICSPPPTLQELLLHNQRMKTFEIQRPNRDAPL